MIKSQTNIELNDVDLEVKKLLLTYPSIFKNRLDALVNIFTTSNYRWTEEGRMVSDDLTQAASSMCYDDIERREAQHSENLDENVSILSRVNEMRGFEIANERARRDAIAANIDLVASQMPSSARFSYEHMQHMNLNSECLSDYYLGGAPFSSIDPAWLDAAEEFIQVLRYSFNVLFHLHYDKPLKGEAAPNPSMFSQMPLSFQNLHNEMERISTLLDAQSGRSKRLARIMERLDIKSIFTKQDITC